MSSTRGHRQAHVGQKTARRDKIVLRDSREPRGKNFVSDGVDDDGQPTCPRIARGPLSYKGSLAADHGCPGRGTASSVIFPTPSSTAAIAKVFIMRNIRCAVTPSAESGKYVAMPLRSERSFSRNGWLRRRIARMPSSSNVSSADQRGIVKSRTGARAGRSRFARSFSRLHHAKADGSEALGSLLMYLQHIQHRPIAFAMWSRRECYAPRPSITTTWMLAFLQQVQCRSFDIDDARAWILRRLKASKNLRVKADARQAVLSSAGLGPASSMLAGVRHRRRADDLYRISALTSSCPFQSRQKLRRSRAFALCAGGRGSARGT